MVGQSGICHTLPESEEVATVTQPVRTGRSSEANLIINPMNSILIVAHAPLAHALRQCVLHVYPEHAEHVVALDVQPNAPFEESQSMARVMLEQLHARPGVTGVLVLADVFGATPFNVVQKLGDTQLRLVTGVNLPMLWSIVNRLTEPLAMLAARALTGGQQGIMQASTTAQQNQTRRNHDHNHHDHQQ